MTDWQFIQDTAQRSFGLPYNTVKKWRVNGVPHKRRLALIREAEKSGFALNEAAFDNPPGRQKGEVASSFCGVATPPEALS